MGSDGLPYEKRVDKKGKVISDTCIQDEVSFEIPSTWTWARLGSIGTTETGKTPPTGNRSYYRGNIPFVTPGDITYSHRLYATARHLSTSGLERSRKAAPGSVLQVCIGGSSGKTCLIDFDCAFNQQINHVSCTVSEVGRYLYCVLISPLIQNRIKQIGSGTATPITNKTKWESFLIPLPPLAEQQRIVDRVRDLLPLVEEYGELEDEREALDQVLPDRLRKSILQQAVSGKLVAQDPADEDASILVERIRKEKHRLISEGKTKFPKGGESVIYIGSDGCHYEKHIDKKGKVISETCIQDEVPFEIPNTWTWARFTTLTVQVGNKNNQVKSKDIAEYGDYPVISQSSIRYIDGYCAASQARPIKSVPVLLFGDHTRAVKFIDHPFVIGADGTKCHNAIVCNPYFLYILMEYFVYKIRNRGYGRHHALLKNEIMPIPPLPEQQRIVDRVKKLLAIITSQ